MPQAALPSKPAFHGASGLFSSRPTPLGPAVGPRRVKRLHGIDLLGKHLQRIELFSKTAGQCLGNRFCVNVFAENVDIEWISLEKPQVAFGQIRFVLTFWLETATQIGFCRQTLTQTGFRRRNLDTKRAISKKPWVARREIGSVHAFGLKTST